MLWTPAWARPGALAGRLVLVVDVIRASTSIVAALVAGARRVVPAVTVEEAEERAAALRAGGEDVLLCGERDGLPPPGFDRGNSPLEHARPGAAGRTLVYTTTNGTRAIRRFARTAAEVRLACFANLTAAVGAARSAGHPVTVVCAGRGGRPGVDDALCAGHLVLRWAREEGRARRREPALSDRARVAARLARRLGEPTPGLLAASAAGRALVVLGVEADLDICARLDTTGAVPALREGALAVPGASGAAGRGARAP